MSKEVTYDQKEEKFIKISSTGYIDFKITLSLTAQEAEIFGVFPEKIEKISDCKEFLKPFSNETQQMTFKTEQFKKSNIYDFIRLSSNNSTINSLIVINRAFKKKAFIEFITLSELRFKPEDAFLREFVKNISEQNFLFLVENNFLPNLDSKIKFLIKIDNKEVRSFENICESSGQPQIDSSKTLLIKDENENLNRLENSLFYNLEKRVEEAKSAKSKSLKSGNNKVTERNEKSVGRISGKSKGSGKGLNNNNERGNLNNSVNNNNNVNVNKVRESSNILFENEENLRIQGEASALQDNKSSYSANQKTLQQNSDENNNINSYNNADDQKLHEQLKLNEGELNELEKELAEKKTNNEVAENKSQVHDLDETANKILTSIPNAGASSSRNLNNQSRISNNSPRNVIDINNMNQSNIAADNNDIIINNNENNVLAPSAAAAQEAEEDAVQLKSKIFSNEDLDSVENKVNTSKLEHLNMDEKEENPEAVLDNENAEGQSAENAANLGNPETNRLSVFERFKYDFSGSDYFFVDINEMLELKIQNFTISDFFSLLKKITEDYKQITIIISFPNIINNIGFLDLESINILNEIIGLTDIYIFDKKDALALFNLMAQINSEEDNYEDKKNLEHLFIKEVKKKRKAYPKIGIFLDELKRVTIIEQQASSNLILFHTDYEFDLIPANVSKIIADDYKKLFVVHYEMLKSVFIGGLFSRTLYKKPFNSGFTAGNESLKRVVELLRFNLDAPLDPNFFMIRIKKNKTLPCEEEKLKQKKEKHFTLDCANVLNSKMKQYNPLHDENLVSYFSSKYIRKHLKNLGFINKKGNIMQDPDSKKLGIIESKKLNKVYEEEKVNLQRINDKKEKLKLQIKNLLQGNNVMKSGNMKEIEKLANVYNFYPQSDKKLPSINEFKKSINRNIKINSDIYLKEIQKGKASRSKSNVRSIGKTEVNSHATGESATYNKNRLLNVFEKIEENILKNDLSKISGTQRNNNNSRNASLKEENLNNNSNNKNNSKVNRSSVINNNILNKQTSNSKINNNSNTSRNDLARAKTKSGKSQMSKAADNSHLKSSSTNKNMSEHNFEGEQDEKGAEMLKSDNNNKSRIASDEKDQSDAKSILNQNTQNNNTNNNNELEIKKEAEEAGERHNASNNEIVNFEPNEKIINSNNNNNDAAENKSVNDNNLNNVSKISKKIDVSGNDLNVSAKKSNLVSEENNNNNISVSKVNINNNDYEDNEKNILAENPAENDNNNNNVVMQN